MSADNQSKTLIAKPTPNEKPMAAVTDQPIARPIRQVRKNDSHWMHS